MKKLAILFALALCVTLAGCNQPAPPQGGEPSQEPSNSVTTSPVEELPTPTPADESIDPTPAEGEQTATLYIGTKAGGFAEYPMSYEGELTAEKLIQGIADLTGWNLTIAEDVISGKGGMSVCLSSLCFCLKDILNTNDKSEPIPHLEDSVRIIMSCVSLTKEMQASNPYPSFPSTTNPAKRSQFGKKPQRSNLAVTFNKSRRKKYGVCGDLA